MIDLEKRIIYLTDADGNKKFAEVREYEQFTTCKAVLPVSYDVVEFAFGGLDENNKEVWTADIEGTEFTGTFSGAVKVTNSGLFTETIKKPKTKRLDIS